MPLPAGQDSVSGSADGVPAVKVQTVKRAVDDRGASKQLVVVAVDAHAADGDVVDTDERHTQTPVGGR
jgi:hypothetical protein